jgi:hypothetical protein
VSLAEYRAGRALSGYHHLMQNAGLTWTQDLGAVTELLSGEFFQPLGRSSAHQIWSSAMVLTPALRGLFGLSWDALRRTLRVAPHLPAAWETARLHNVTLGDSRFDLEFTRQSDRLIVRARSDSPQTLCLLSETGGRCSPAPAISHEIVLPLPAVEIGVSSDLPLPGAKTTQLKIVGERHAAARYEVEFEGWGGSEYNLPVRLNRAARATGADLTGSALHLRFPAGDGYQRVAVAFTW